MYASSAGGGAMALVFKPTRKDGKQEAAEPAAIKKPVRKRTRPSRRAANA